MTNRFRIVSDEEGARLDVFLADRLHLTRSKVHNMVGLGCVRANGAIPKLSLKVRRSMVIEGEVPEDKPLELAPEEIPLTVLYEDDYLIAIDKPAGMVVHPSAGHSAGTLVNALLAHLAGERVRSSEFGVRKGGERVRSSEFGVRKGEDTVRSSPSSRLCRDRSSGQAEFGVRSAEPPPRLHTPTIHPVSSQSQTITNYQLPVTVSHDPRSAIRDPRSPFASQSQQITTELPSDVYRVTISPQPIKPMEHSPNSELQTPNSQPVERSAALRPGIVHRLDKGTTGVILVAKDGTTQDQLSQLFKDRNVRKTYRALVEGTVERDHGTVEGNIGRHPVDRKKMAVLKAKGRTAATSYRVLNRLKGFTYLEAYPTTGRTHQIRVHLAHIGHAVVGDETYGRSARKLAPRPLLHAYRLEFQHPRTHQNLVIEAPVPEDIKEFLAGNEVQA
jgi:23S rRNA-/tRNA-specific pseudouridylate synthase